MDPTRCVQLIKRRAVAKASLTRLQNFIEEGDQKINEIQVRFNKLPDIFNKYESAQDELECLDETDYTLRQSTDLMFRRKSGLRERKEWFVKVIQFDCKTIV